eukprot:1875283-Pyramimonas_sp.AAC.1
MAMLWRAYAARDARLGRRSVRPGAADLIRFRLRADAARSDAHLRSDPMSRFDADRSCPSATGCEPYPCWVR